MANPVSSPVSAAEKDDLLQHMRRSWAALEDLVKGLPEAQMTAGGPNDGWSVKDHLAHMTAWHQKLIAGLEGRPAYEGLEVDAATYEGADTDGMNAILYRRNRDRPLAEVLAAWRQSHARVLALVEPMTPQELGQRYFPEDPDDRRNRMEGIRANTYAHYDEHRASIQALLSSPRG